jgi:hypothetical protein
VVKRVTSRRRAFLVTARHYQRGAPSHAGEKVPELIPQDRSAKSVVVEHQLLGE